MRDFISQKLNLVYGGGAQKLWHSSTQEPWSLTWACVVVFVPGHSDHNSFAAIAIATVTFGSLAKYAFQKCAMLALCHYFWASPP